MLKEILEHIRCFVAIVIGVVLGVLSQINPEFCESVGEGGSAVAATIGLTLIVIAFVIYAGLKGWFTKVTPPAEYQ